MSQENTDKSKKVQKSTGKLIQAALTEQEVSLLLDALLESLPTSSLEIALNQLPMNTHQTLHPILFPSCSSTATEGATLEYDKTDTFQTDLRHNPNNLSSEVSVLSSFSLGGKPASLAKLEETWGHLWQQWDEFVCEATSEDGKYIDHEESWHPPYFNDSAFTEDLEALALEMLPLLPTAYEHKFSPNIDFAEALQEMAEDITDALTDSVELVNENFYLENCLTKCLLQWFWLKTQEEGLDVFGFTQEVREWEERATQVKLEQSAFECFFIQLPEADLQRIYQGLTTNRKEFLWKPYLENINSHWYKIYLHYQERYAPEQYLETLRASISVQWENGLPVIEDLLAKKAYQDSLVVVEETLVSLLKSSRNTEPWSPESSLFLSVFGVFDTTNDCLEKHIKFLGYYQQVASSLNQSERVQAIQLQLTAIEHCFNWSVMLSAFNNTNVSETTKRNLFRSWRDYILRVTFGRISTWGEKNGDSSWWLSWLLDSIEDPQQQPEEFQRLIKHWLQGVASDDAASRQTFSALRLLTHDLAEIGGHSWNQYPKFKAVVIVPGSLQTQDAESRRSFLKQLSPKDFWNEVMTYWQNHLERWIPKPETARNSDYTEHAEWMAALRELSPIAYQNLLAQWQVQHRRRRNLWNALKHI